MAKKSSKGSNGSGPPKLPNIADFPSQKTYLEELDRVLAEHHASRIRPDAAGPYSQISADAARKDGIVNPAAKQLGT